MSIDCYLTITYKHNEIWKNIFNSIFNDLYIRHFIYNLNAFRDAGSYRLCCLLFFFLHAGQWEPWMNNVTYLAINVDNFRLVKYY